MHLFLFPRDIRREAADQPPCEFLDRAVVTASTNDVSRVIDAARGLTIEPRAERWAHLSLCVLDAVFSINAAYQSTVNVCHRYARHAGLVALVPPEALLPVREQEPLDHFLDVGRLEGANFAVTVLENRARTSTRSGITKADAAVQYAEILTEHGLRTLDDTTRVLTDLDAVTAIDRDLATVHGHGRGARREYLWMLVGSDVRVKPDRMVLGWLRGRLDRPVDFAEAGELLPAAARSLGCSAWELDHAIWSAQRTRVVARPSPSHRG